MVIRSATERTSETLGAQGRSWGARAGVRCPSRGGWGGRRADYRVGGGILSCWPARRPLWRSHGFRAYRLAVETPK
jgi:hypothetical protein